MNENDREGETMQGGQTQAGRAGTNPAGPSANADLGVNSSIGRRLKAFYDDVASEPVPDRFLSLLDALDRAEASARRPGEEQESA